MSAEKFLSSCDDCHYSRAYDSLLEARTEAERHGRACKHCVRVYLTRTEQVGDYDVAKDKFDLLADLRSMG